MFDLAWSEMLVIAVVAVVAIGPKELPAVMRAAGRFARRMQYMKYALSQQFEDFMQQSELHELRREASLRTDGDAAAEAEADEDMMEAEPLGPQNNFGNHDDTHPKND